MLKKMSNRDKLISLSEDKTEKTSRFTEKNSKVILWSCDVEFSFAVTSFVSCQGTQGLRGSSGLDNADRLMTYPLM